MPRAAPHSHPSAPASHGPGRPARRPVLALPVSWQPARALPSGRDPRARRAGALLEHSVTHLQRASVPGTCCGESQRLGRCPVGFRRSTAAAGGLGWPGSVGRSRKSQKSRSPGPGRRGPPEPPRLEGARSRRAPLCVHASLSHAHVIVGRPCRSRVLRHGSAVGALVPGTSWGSGPGDLLGLSSRGPPGAHAPPDRGSPHPESAPPTAAPSPPSRPGFGVSVGRKLGVGGTGHGRP